MSEISGHIHHAIALRHLAAARSNGMRKAAPEFQGLPAFSQLIGAYTKIGDGWLAETPHDAHDVLALVHFVIALVGRKGCDREGNSSTGEARDRFDALVALDSIREWVNEIDLKELRHELVAARENAPVEALIEEAVRARTGADA